MAVRPGLPATWSSKPSLSPSASSDICGFDLKQVRLLQGRSVYFLSVPMVRSKTSQEQNDRLVTAVGNWKEKGILKLCFEPVLAPGFSAEASVDVPAMWSRACSGKGPYRLTELLTSLPKRGHERGWGRQPRCDAAGLLLPRPSRGCRADLGRVDLWDCKTGVLLLWEQSPRPC